MKITNIKILNYSPSRFLPTFAVRNILMKKPGIEELKRRFGDLREDLIPILSDELGLGEMSVSTALLSDAWLEERITAAEVAELFGSGVLTLLNGLQTISGFHVEKSLYHSENFIQLLLGLAKDIRVVLIRMAEVLLGIRMAGQLPKNQRKRLAGEAYYLYAPIAHRLGYYHIKTELEERAMQILFPADYNQIAGKLKETERARNQYIRKFITPMEESLRRQGFVFEIKGRPKSIHSIWKKMKKQQVVFKEVYDLLAIRVVLKEILEGEKSDCWKIYSLITDIYPPNPTRFRDWVSTPKLSGYEALHTTVQGPDGKWVEVQIRTGRMDEKAEKGEAAHWLYKEGKILEESDEWLVSLRKKLENPGTQMLEAEESGLIDLKDPHIFIFTPQGDLKRLADGSSVLDFAFQVHSDIGTHCTGAKVNGKIVPIKHILKNGDTVEIRTSKNQKPKKDWLKFVVSPRTRQKIKKTLRDEELKDAEAGKDLFFRKLKNWKISFSDTTLDKVVQLLRYDTHMEMYHAIAIGKLDPAQVKEAILHLEQAGPKTEESTLLLPSQRTEEKSEDVIFLDQGLANVNYSLASCCQPVFGDSVFGFVTVTRGISVHRKNCPNAKDLQKRYKYRVVQVKWRKSAGTTAFQTTLKIEGIDKLGMLNTISDIITNELNINIRSASIESKKGVFKGTLKIYIKDHYYPTKIKFP